MAGTAADVTLEEARRALDEQRTTLTDVRTRAGVVFSVAGLTSSFLAGPALDGHTGLPALAAIALGLLLGAVIAALTVYWPKRRRPFKFTVKPAELLGPDWTRLKSEQFNQALAGHAGKAADNNETELDRLWCGVRLSMIFTFLSITAWVALLAKGP